jgi:hypothetical protein
MLAGQPKGRRLLTRGILSCVILRRVADVSKEYITSDFRVKEKTSKKSASIMVNTKISYNIED